ATGFNNRVGMLKNLRVPLVTTVLLANSAGVSSGRTLAGTAGRLPGARTVKLPLRISEVGMLPALTWTGAKSQRRSYERRKNVFLREKGTGPLSDPPVSFRLKYGVGKVEMAGVGRNLASSTLSWVVHA